ncbi:OmpH family outer membrane protein [Hymenobacter sp. BT491]|uniref:OmpH family outer membrane protein n=1 Tax=Hymenobacter sp. BT491 TaxID=2766779 RepID=UPI001653D70E|nr:OmpH family outer membrane protein [Hymenobacter sp. BT491]MBC6988160.1 OmpH family outer membrane protein [Hymenobacter sp. BT491]
MNNSLRLIIDAVLVIAVAVLFYLHFADKSAAKVAPAKVVATKTDSTGTVTTEPSTAVVADTDKVAFVVSDKLLADYKGMQDARKAFEGKAKGWERQNETLVRNFQAAVQKYQQQAPSLTPEQRAATEQQLETQRIQSGQKQQQIQQQAQEQEAKMTKQVLDRVDKQVETYGKANGYRLILISAPGGAIAYGRKDMDITAAVVKYLNQEYTAKK